jgi:predicted phage tail protein
MAQNRQSATVFLVAVLLFCPAISAGKNRVRKPNNMLPSFEQQLEENENQIRMTNSEAAKQNQYPYMVS